MKNPKTVMKENAALRAELARTQTELHVANDERFEWRKLAAEKEAGR